MLAQLDVSQVKNQDGTWSNVGMLLVAVASMAAVTALLYRKNETRIDEEIKSLRADIATLKIDVRACEVDRLELHKLCTSQAVKIADLQQENTQMKFEIETLKIQPKGL